MITRFKLFENFEEPEFKEGDYVVCLDSWWQVVTPTDFKAYTELKFFLSNNVGIIGDEDDNEVFNVRYKFVPEDLEDFFRYMGSIPPSWIEEGEKVYPFKKEDLRLATKEEIEAEKYNL